MIIIDELTDRLISKSQLSTFSWCPLKYKKQYIDGIRSESNHTLAVGSRIHSFFNTFFDIAPNYDPNSWLDFIHPDFSDYEKKMIECFINYEHRRLQKLNHNFDAWLPVLRETTVINEELGLRGIIDRVDKVDDRYIIVEYKTSKSIYRPSLQKEFGFYTYLLKNTVPYKNWNIPLCCVINPRLGQIEYMAPSKDSTIIKQLNDLRNSKESYTSMIESLNDYNFHLNGLVPTYMSCFPPTCTEAKMAYCGLCSIDESNMFNKGNW